VSQRLTRTAATAAIVVVFLGLAPSALAVSESGDAGDLPSTAQDLGSGPVNEILGSFTGGGDVDVYRVCLSDGASFSASTVGQTALDTQIFLFDSEGFGVYANDDAASGVRGSRLPAHHRFSPTAGGEFYLALSSWNNDPRSGAGEIFPDGFMPNLYPDAVVNAVGVGGDEPVGSWSGPTRGAPGLYGIALTGAGCDTTPPTVALSSPADGAHLKQGADLVVDFSCSDTGGSGLASCVGSVADGERLDTSHLGELSVTVTARDNAGNETVVTHTVTVVDETKPTISLTTPAADAVYELGQPVLADYSCADEPNGSGLDSCVGSVANGAPVDTGSLGEKTFTVNASDEAGNTASKSVTYTVVDATPPNITVTTPADGAVYAVGQQLTADYACTDDHSGVASCVGSVAVGAAVDTGSVGEKSFTVEAADEAGNTASKTVNYTVADRTAPTITLTSPAEGAVYTLGEMVLADYSCADEPNGSGVATCQGNVADGAALDTSEVGAKTFKVSATDNAGNQGAKSVAYSVVYDFDGFLWPLENLPQLNRWKAGRPVPVRFSLGSYRGPAPVAAGYPAVAPVACSAGAQPAGIVKARGTWTRSWRGRSKRGRGTYTFLWKTEHDWAGDCRQLVLKLDDGTLHRVEVQFVRRGNNPDWERDWDDEG
jgi:uncharacterized UPF0146 family protein